MGFNLSTGLGTTNVTAVDRKMQVITVGDNETIILSKKSGVFNIYVLDDPLIYTEIHYTVGSEPDLVFVEGRPISGTFGTEEKINIFESANVLFVENRLGESKKIVAET